MISIIVLIVMQCSKTTDSSKYLQETNYDGTLCHSIQYRSGDKRYMLVGPRMSIGSTIVPGSNGNTLVVPDRRSRASGEVRAGLILILHFLHCLTPYSRTRIKLQIVLQKLDQIHLFNMSNTILLQSCMVYLFVLPTLLYI